MVHPVSWRKTLTVPPVVSFCPKTMDKAHPFSAVTLSEEQWYLEHSAFVASSQAELQELCGQAGSKKMEVRFRGRYLQALKCETSK